MTESSVFCAAVTGSAMLVHEVLAMVVEATVSVMLAADTDEIVDSGSEVGVTFSEVGVVAGIVCDRF